VEEPVFGDIPVEQGIAFNLGEVAEKPEPERKSREERHEQKNDLAGVSNVHGNE
jgi:hypothetical protein